MSYAAAPIYVSFFLILLTFVVCYLLNTLWIEPHLPFWLPTISELGDRPPASSIFTLGFSLSTFIFLWVVFARFKDLHHTLPIERYRNINRVACASGLLFCFSLLVVCSFQSSLVPYVHYVAAACLFFFANVYCWLNCVISAKLRVFRSWSLSVGIVRLRVALALLQSLSFGGVVTFSSLWAKYESGTDDLYFWNYVALCEYLTALTLGLYLLTFAGAEFRSLDVQFVVDGKKRNGKKSSF